MSLFKQLPAYDVSVIGNLVPENFDDIQVAYPTTSTETYTYYYKGTQVAQVTVTYTDATKANLSRAQRTA